MPNRENVVKWFFQHKPTGSTRDSLPSVGFVHRAHQAWHEGNTHFARRMRERVAAKNPNAAQVLDTLKTAHDKMGPHNL